jgi:hypothetical protein
LSFKEDEWFEVWFAEGVDVGPSYLLILKPDPSTPGKAIVIDRVLAVRRRDLRLPFAFPRLCLSSAFAKPKKDFFSFFMTHCRKNVSLRQNGVGTVFFRADAILPKRHELQNQDNVMVS